MSPEFQMSLPLGDVCHGHEVHAANRRLNERVQQQQQQQQSCVQQQQQQSQEQEPPTAPLDAMRSALGVDSSHDQLRIV